MEEEDLKNLEELATAIREWFGEEAITVEEVAQARERYEEAGISFDGNLRLYYSWLWSSILEERAAQRGPDETVFLLPEDDRCSRTDGFCPSKMANRDCRSCQFYRG